MRGAGSIKKNLITLRVNCQFKGKQSITAITIIGKDKVNSNSKRKVQIDLVLTYCCPTRQKKASGRFLKPNRSIQSYLTNINQASIEGNLVCFKRIVTRIIDQ